MRFKAPVVRGLAFFLFTLFVFRLLMVQSELYGAVECRIVLGKLGESRDFFPHFSVKIGDSHSNFTDADIKLHLLLTTLQSMGEGQRP